MSFMRLPGEDPSTMLGGGDWANEYSYKNPNTGKWEYSRSPRTYGDNGNQTYEEWMQEKYGWKPGTYGASAADNAYNEWLKSVTPEGKGRMNGKGEFIVGTKPNEATKSEASQLGESESISANEESLSTSEDKGTDYSWITAATEEAMPEQEKTEEKSETASEDYNTFGLDKSEKKSKYPNGMSEDEFNAMYEFALGMSGKGENTENGVWGSFETLPLRIPELNEELNRYEKSGNKKKANAAREQLESAKKQLESFENFISNYKDLYSPKKEETKKTEKDAELEKQYERAKDKITDFYVQRSQLEDKAYNTRDEILVGHEWAPDKESYDEDPSEYEGWIDSDKEEYGPGNVYNYTGSDDDFAAKVNAANNAWDQVALIEKNIADAERIINEYSGTASTETKVTKQDIMNDYAAGKINAYQAAVALTKAEGPMSFIYDDIVSDIDYNKFSDPVAGSRGDGTVGIDSFMSDVTGPDIMAGETEASPTDISKKITAEFTSLNEIKAELDNVDVSSVTNDEEAKAANDKITALTKNAVEVANRDFVAIYKELVESGIEAKELASNPKVKQLSQEAFGIGQDIYEKASELEAKTNELGLTNLDKKYIKKHLDEVSLKVGQLDAENNKAVGSYYSPGSNMNGVQPTGINLSKEEVKALADYANDIQSTKDAAIAIMKSAAFNGAENVEGGKYVEEWKNAKALETGNFKEGAQEFVKDKGKLTWKDYFAAGAKGTLGTAVAILGGAVTAVNPVLGILLMTVGTASATKAGLEITTDVVRSKSTNKEMMFGSGEGGKDVFRDIYNRSLESANIGDAKSVGTYTNLGNGALSIVAGLVELIENPVIGVAAIRSGVEDINKAGNGGLAGNLDTAVKNIYDLGVDISTFLDRNDLKPEALGLTENLPTFIPNIKDKNIWNGNYTVYVDTENNAAGPAAASEYGSAETSEELSEEEKEALDATYSGAKEQAKNSNLATDYNAGMEQNVNEAVSDERVKGYIVKIYGSEPGYIRNAISKILAAHSEHEWN